MLTSLTAPVLAGLLAAPAASASPVVVPLPQLYPELEAFYVDLHQTPELSLHEEKTSAKLAAKLEALGYEVTEKVGGFGVVAVMKNGSGPTVLIRADMDALPVEEKTGLPYASRVVAKNDAGVDVPVMHACGHDVHMTSLVGAATLLARAKKSWRGTLVLVGQPAEELGGGALRMVDDRLPRALPQARLRDRPPRHARASGRERSATRRALPSPRRTAVDITVYGRGGHGSRPEATVDPIVIAARIVTALQTIVAREVNPFDAAVVTVGSIHGGTKHNIIPDEVKLQLTVRSYKPEVRRRVIASIERIAKAEAEAAGAPKAPLVVTGGHGPTYNDPALTRRIAASLTRTFGADHVVEAPPVMGGEDFGEFGKAAGAPSLIFWLGASPPAAWAAAAGDVTKLPSLHSSNWAPDREPTLKAGATALVVAAMELLRKP